MQDMFFLIQKLDERDAHKVVRTQAISTHMERNVTSLYLSRKHGMKLKLTAIEKELRS